MSHTLLTVLVGLLSTILGGGGMWAFLKGWQDRAAAREESEIGRLRIDVDALRLREGDCQAKLLLVEARIEAMEQAQDSHIARWIKDGHKRITSINAKALLTIFAPLGYTREDVIGKTFAELDRLDPQVSAEIDRLDRLALARDGAASSSLITFHPLLPEMHVVKVAAAGHDGELIYEGYAYRKNDPDLSDGVGAGRQRQAIVSSAGNMLGGPTK